KYLFIFVIPFFFVSMGLNFDPSALWVNPKILIIIISIAFLGKFIGTFLSKPFTKLNWKKLYIVGCAMNSRGAIELALALIAFRTNLIPIEIYSGLIMMTLITTIIFPFLIVPLIKKNPKIMN
ncbi:cation:proton antiporter, partial [Patescibacteria group bacterium]|nr:cation:proton antiporter [Patescibacteria group bacterium]